MRLLRTRLLGKLRSESVQDATEERKTYAFTVSMVTKRPALVSVAADPLNSTIARLPMQK
ncbi:hypothetical protein Taro_015744 [Colocasia esculenta]|uniref:Uncharacterized protein n=1 Tax=Colocasia esculenta TaxID=4460 RepID=A0A843ULN1_COLES|nr:hypothetical protein [Colocasia esculenta]